MKIACWLICGLALTRAVATQAADYAKGLAAYQRGDYAEAFAEFQPLAEQGSAEAQASLGLMYLIGRGVPRDYEQAFTWSSKGAVAGSSRAQFDLGYLYLRGLGTTQDLAKAFFWFQKAAASGSIPAQADLGMLYLKGWGVGVNYTQAARHFGIAAAAGNAEAEADLGTLYAEGEGVPKDKVIAYALYSDAAHLGLPDAGGGRPRTYDRDITAKKMTPSQIASGEMLASLIDQVGVQTALEIFTVDRSTKSGKRACAGASDDTACKVIRMNAALRELDVPNDGAMQGQVLSRYMAAIRRAITQQWLPPNNMPDTACIVHITQLPGGNVLSANVDSACTYGETARRSVEDAVLRAQPLPYHGFESVFRQTIDLRFVPLP